MQTIEIDDEVYEYLLRNSAKIGESATEILRRLLQINTPTTAPKEETVKYVTKSELSEYLQSPAFQAKRKAIDRFFGILYHVHNEKTDDFKKVLSLRGRNRQYFALSSREIEESGNSAHPQKIPGTEYWVITNNDTPKKRRMIEDVLKVLGYSRSAIAEATSSLI
ncbi:replication initiation regulator SeqA [Thermodesulfobacteriota bacterium]